MNCQMGAIEVKCGNKQSESNMMLVALLNKFKLIAIKKKWVFQPNAGKITKVFYSPFEDETLSLSSPSFGEFQEGVAGWYDAYILVQFGKYRIDKCIYILAFQFYGDNLIFLPTETKHHADQFIEMYDRMLRGIEQNITSSKTKWNQTMPFIVSNNNIIQDGVVWLIYLRPISLHSFFSIQII